jgi:putative lipoprotein
MSPVNSTAHVPVGRGGREPVGSRKSRRYSRRYERRGRCARVRNGLAFFLGFTTIGAWSAAARAADPDPLFGPDKALHFAVSATISGSGYAMTTAFAEQRWKALAVGGGAALTAGALKEAYDATGHGDPSWKDFGWDVVGAAAGLLVAWGIDVVIHGGIAPPIATRDADGR